MRKSPLVCVSIVFFTFLTLVLYCRTVLAYTMDEYKAAIKNSEKTTELMISGMADADKITSIPADIKKFRNLKKLYINNLRKLKSLPKEIGNLKELTELHMEQGNDCEPMKFALPEAIGLLINLKILNLSGAFNLDAKPLPKNISKLSQLEELDLGRCELKELPVQTAELKSLKKLVLEYNSISALPDFVSGLSNLEELNLSYTGVKTLPDSFVNFKKLTVIMGNNQLKLSDQRKLADKFKNIKFSFENIYDDSAVNETPDAPAKNNSDNK